MIYIIASTIVTVGAVIVFIAFFLYRDLEKNLLALQEEHVALLKEHASCVAANKEVSQDAK